MKATIKMVNAIPSGFEVIFEYDDGQQVRSKVAQFGDNVLAAEIKSTIRAFLESKAVAPRLKTLRDNLIGDVIEV